MTQKSIIIPAFSFCHRFFSVISNDRLCENTVHGSTRLTTNGVVSLEIEYLSVRPEHRRRAPREFSHSLSLEMTIPDVVVDPSELKIGRYRSLYLRTAIFIRQSSGGKCDGNSLAG